MSQVVLGVYETAPAGGNAQVARRRQQIQEHCTATGLSAPSFAHPSFVRAAVEAREMVRQGASVVLVGALADLQAPAATPGQAQAFTAWEWREAWLARLDEESIGWSAIEPRGSGEEGRALSTTSVIRSYRRACVALSKAIARARTQRTIAQRCEQRGVSNQGRPPYGYQMVNSALLPEAAEVDRIKRAFKAIRDGMTVSAAARHMSDHEPSKKPEFWDSVKIRRILAHAPLYCLGIRKGPKGREEQSEEWRILPQEWADTPSLPAQRRTGTLVPSPATP
jgi:hypothetical protein